MFGRNVDEPTYWPSDCILPLFILWSPTNKISTNNKILNTQRHPTLYSTQTNWNLSDLILDVKLDNLTELNVPLKTNINTEQETEKLKQTIQTTAWEGIPDCRVLTTTETCPII